MAKKIIFIGLQDMYRPCFLSMLMGQGFSGLGMLTAIR